MTDLLLLQLFVYAAVSSVKMKTSVAPFTNMV